MLVDELVLELDDVSLELLDDDVSLLDDEDDDAALEPDLPLSVL